MSILPNLSGAGLVDYMALAAGLLVGSALFAGAASAVGSAISKSN